jgi:hypothetical protein
MHDVLQATLPFPGSLRNVKELSYSPLERQLEDDNLHIAQSWVRLAQLRPWQS